MGGEGTGQISTDRHSVTVAVLYNSRLDTEKASIERKEKTENAANKQCSHLKDIPSYLAPANWT